MTELSATLAEPPRARDTSGGAEPTLPFVTILMPTLNEAAHLDATLASLLQQDYPADRFEVVVMDGRSTDGTREQLDAWARREPRVRWFDNPGVIVSTALNLGFPRVRGSIVARADGHSTYAPDYLRAAVAAFEKSGADVVGGPMVAARELSPFQQAVAAALASPFGMGGAAFHFEGRSEAAEAVYLGVYRADALRRFGPFDELLVRDEDDEWFARARRRGAKVWLDGAIRSAYTPRGSLSSLARQYFGYGLYKPAALCRVPGSRRLRHLVPSALVAALALPLVTPWPAFALLPLVAYAAALLLASVRARPRQQPFLPALLRQAAVFATMHLAYGVGYLAGLRRDPPDPTPEQMRAIYAGYARDPRKRAAWSESQPGQVAIVRERDAALAAALRERFGARVGELSLLDLGAGDRDLAAALAEQGAAPRRVVACDLLAERLARNPQRRRVAADSRLLPFRSGSFDVVVQCTMLSSVRAPAARRVIAAEMARVCRPDGLLLSYDARAANPLNRHVRRLPRAEHAALFPDRPVAFRRLTPLPPLVRRLPWLFALLARIKPLCLFDLAAIGAAASAPRSAAGAS